METVLKKWGNSVGVRIPSTMIKTAGWAEGDKVVMTENDGVITIKKMQRPHRRTLEQIAMDEYGMTLDEIGMQKEKEMDWGTPVGKEIW